MIVTNVDKGEKMNNFKIDVLERLSTKMAKYLDQNCFCINYKYYTEQIWGKSQNYTLTLNSSKLGYDKVIDIICNL